MPLGRQLSLLSQPLRRDMMQPGAASGFGKGLVAGAAGIPGDLANMLLQMRPAGPGPGRRGLIQNQLSEAVAPATSEGIAGLLGADPSRPTTQAGLIGAPDPRDFTRAIGLLAAGTPEFARMFRNSKLVDDSGRPQKLFHGSTGEIERFDLSKANPESDWGAGIYLTNNIDDVNANYAGFGPDLTNKIELRMEQLRDEAAFSDPSLKSRVEKMSGKSWSDLSYDERGKELRKIARDEISSTNEGQITPLFAAVENPVVVGGDRQTFLDLVVEYDEAGDIVGEGGPLLEFAEAIRENAHKYDDFDHESFISDILESSNYESISARDIQDISKQSESIIYATNESGQLVNGEIIREAFEEMGFDGIIDRTVNEKFGSARKFGQSMAGVDENTVHVIVFDPDKLNTAIGSK